MFLQHNFIACPLILGETTDVKTNIYKDQTVIQTVHHIEKYVFNCKYNTLFNVLQIFKLSITEHFCLPSEHLRFMDGEGMPLQCGTSINVHSSSLYCKSLHILT
jgi:hypothetical protein